MPQRDVDACLLLEPGLELAGDRLVSVREEDNVLERTVFPPPVRRGPRPWKCPHLRPEGPRRQPTSEAPPPSRGERNKTTDVGRFLPLRRRRFVDQSRTYGSPCIPRLLARTVNCGQVCAPTSPFSRRSPATPLATESRALKPAGASAVALAPVPALDRTLALRGVVATGGKHMNTQAPITVLVDVETDAIEAHIRDHRADSLAVFAPLSETQRTGLVTDAWTLGLRALMNAYKQAEESRLQDIGKALKEDLDRQLSDYVERQQTTFVQVLARFFDPRDGQVVTRLEGFLRDGGDLAKTMDRFLAPEHGALAQTLARELGENSPLLKRLSPTDSEGVLFLLEAKLREALADNQAEVARALDPVAEDGAVARFLRALRQELEKADNDRSKQLALATKALDANDENSLLSRLMRETAAAKNAFVAAMNPELPSSPMAMLKNTLSTLLQQHAQSQQEAMVLLQERHTKFEQDVRESLVRLEERKRGDAKSTRGGYTYEDAVLRFVQRAVQGAPIEVNTTANTVGAKPNCKKGDQVLRFTAESAYAGGALVVEAKHDASYTVSRALEELELARGNRTAGAGVFVMARSHAAAGFPSFARYGNDVLVVWDEEDEATDPYLHAAILLGLALASRHRRPDDAGDIEALADIEHRIQKELDRLDKMRKLVESIRGDAEKLGEEVRKGTNGFDLLLRKAKSTLKALNVELTEAEGAKSEPVMLPVGSLTLARDALVVAPPEASLASEERKSA